MMIKLLINAIWFDTSISTHSACLIWEFLFQGKIFHGLRSLAPILPKPYVDHTATYATCRYILLYEMCDPIDIYFILVWSRSHTLATSALEVSYHATRNKHSPMLVFLFREMIQRRHELSKKKMGTWRSIYEKKRAIAMLSRTYKGEGKTAQKESTSTSTIHAQSWSTCMMHYLYGFDLWFCNRSIASTYPHIPHQAPLQPCIRVGMRDLW
jgi:hypothetical protein